MARRTLGSVVRIWWGKNHFPETRPRRHGGPCSERVRLFCAVARAGVWAVGSKWGRGTGRREGGGQRRDDPGGLGRDAGPLLAARQGSGRGDAHLVALLGPGQLGGREGLWNGMTGSQPVSSRPDSRVPFLELFFRGLCWKGKELHFGRSCHLKERPQRFTSNAPSPHKKQSRLPQVHRSGVGFLGMCWKAIGLHSSNDLSFSSLRYLRQVL